MSLRQPLIAREWLMTDERIGEQLWEAIAQLPPRTGGIVFRHYSLGAKEREKLAREIASLSKTRGLALAVGRDTNLAIELGAGMVHNPQQPGELPFSRSVHNEEEARLARDSGASLVFISPVYPTRSHVGHPALGLDEASRLAEIASCPAIALGGMNRERFKLMDGVFAGFAGIDCWLRT